MTRSAALAQCARTTAPATVSPACSAATVPRRRGGGHRRRLHHRDPYGGPRRWPAPVAGVRPVFRRRPPGARRATSTPVAPGLVPTGLPATSTPALACAVPHLQVISMEGYGTDAYVFLRRLGDAAEPLSECAHGARLSELARGLAEGVISPRNNVGATAIKGVSVDDLHHQAFPQTAQQPHASFRISVKLSPSRSASSAATTQPSAGAASTAAAAARASAPSRPSGGMALDGVHASSPTGKGPA
jgi:hypothetical protein